MLLVCVPYLLSWSLARRPLCLAPLSLEPAIVTSWFLSGLIEPAPFFVRLGVSPEECSSFGGDLDFLFGFFLGMFRH